MKNILVGIDFHEETDKLINETIKYTKPFKPKIWLLHTAAPNPAFVGFEAGPESVRDYRAMELKEEQKKLQEYVKNIKSQDFDADGLLIQGPTIEVIIEESKKLNIDLIVCGHHEHSFLYSLFFGNTSTEIVKKSKTPVLVVPL